MGTISEFTPSRGPRNTPSWSLPWTPLPPGRRRGARWPARRCGSPRTPCAPQTPAAGVRGTGAALQVGAGPLLVCEGAFDALALLAAGVPRVVAIFGVQGWRWDWVRDVRELVFALDADAAGQQQGRVLARQAAWRGKRVAVLEPAAYGGCKDASAAAEALILRAVDRPKP